MKSSILALVLPVLIMTADGAAAKDTELNPAHDTLQKQDLTSRKRTLGKVLNSGGKECRSVTKTFYQGFDTNKAAYWNARCQDGTEYLLQFPQSKFDNIRIVDCQTMADADLPCFTKSKQLKKR